jgi:hypothetical protein
MQASGAAGGGQDSNQLRKQIGDKESEIKKWKEESQKAQGETERLLQLMQMSQEEQFAKDKTIMELQEYDSVLYDKNDLLQLKFSLLK